MTTAEYAEKHNLTIEEVREKCKSGELQAVEVDGRWDIKESNTPETEKVLEEIQNMPMDAGQPTMMSPEMQAEIMKQQQQFIVETIKTAANKILSGEVKGDIPREMIPSNIEVLAMDISASSYTISVMMEIIKILTDEAILNEAEACSLLEGYVDLFNVHFTTWRSWVNRVKRFIGKHIENPKAIKKASNTVMKIDWQNFKVWVYYSLINTINIRNEVTQRYFQPTEAQK